MKPAELCITKLNMRFTGNDGNDVNFDYIEIEVAPNLYAKINLTPNNVRVLQKYNPDLYQLVANTPLGHEIIFEQKGDKPVKHLDGIYSTDNSNML